MNDQRKVDTWASAEERYRVGQETRGVVTRLAQFGVFVQLEPGIEGILYTFELGLGAGALARFAPGQEVRVYVKDIEPRKKRLELGLEAQPMPGLLAERELPPQVQHKISPDDLLRSAPPPPAQIAARFSGQICPSCQRSIQESWKYCVYCGGALQSRCPACGTIQPDLPEARYCCECGSILR